MPLIGTKLPNYTKLYTFQTLNIDLLTPKLKLNIHLTKSPKHDHIYKLCLYTRDEN